MEQENKIVLSPKYKSLWQSDKRYHIVTGGRGSGKSFGVTLFLLTLTFEPKHIILFTRYTLTSAKTSIIPQFIEVMELMGYTSEHFEVTQDQIINKATGSKILFKGIKTSSGVQTASLKSLTGVTTWVLDEAEELTDEDLFQKIDYSVRVKDVKNRVILVMNPATKEHFIYQRWFTPQEGDNNTNYIHTTYKDNIDNLSDDVLNDYKRLQENDPDKYRHIVEGAWLDKAEGVIFTNWEQGEFTSELPYIYGLDIGAKDPDACIKVAVDNKRNKVYLEEVLYKSGLGDNELYRAIKDEVGRKTVVIDAAAKKTKITLQNLGLNMKKSKKPKIVDRIKKFLDFDIIVCGHSPNLVKEFNNYTWLISKEVPEDKYNHCMDAWMYAALELSNSNRGVII